MSKLKQIVILLLVTYTTTSVSSQTTTASGTEQTTKKLIDTTTTTTTTNPSVSTASSIPTIKAATLKSTSAANITTTQKATRSTKTTTSATTTAAASNFRRCLSNNTHCNNNGECYESTNGVKFCSCHDKYYGSTCEDKVSKVMDKIVFALGILCAILLVLVIVISCHLHHKLCEVEEIKLKTKIEKKAEKRNRQVGFTDTSKQPCDKSFVQSDDAGSGNDGYLFDITPTGIERSSSFQQNLDKESKNDVAVTVDVNNKGNLDGTDARLFIPSKTDLNNEDNISVSSGVSGAGSAVLLLPGEKHSNSRPYSWAGPASEPHEDLNKIYRDLYHEGDQIDRRGYVKRHHLTPHHGDLKGYNQYSDNRGKPRSMTDLRVLALQGNGRSQKALSVDNYPVGHQPRKTISVENIHTGQVTRLSPKPKSPNAGRRHPKKQGIWARQHAEMLESPF